MDRLKLPALTEEEQKLAEVLITHPEAVMVRGMFHGTLAAYLAVPITGPEGQKGLAPVAVILRPEDAGYIEVYGHNVKASNQVPITSVSYPRDSAAGIPVSTGQYL